MLIEEDIVIMQVFVYDGVIVLKTYNFFLIERLNVVTTLLN